MLLFEILKSVLYGIVEGITEWLPVSSTGHLILVEDFFPFSFEGVHRDFNAEFGEMFQMVIQLGAIMAVVVLFWQRLWPFSRKKTGEEKRATWLLWSRIAVASIPAAAVGFGLDKLIEVLSGKDIDGWLYNSVVVAIALIVYGIAFVVIERVNRRRTPRVERIDQLSYRTALAIGAFQALSMVPGTSRSGSTILGSILLGVSRTAAAEFAFFMAIPVMVGASGLKALRFVLWIVEDGVRVPVDAWVVLGVGCLVSFLVSMVAIPFLMDFVKRHSFAPFGVYRIVLGAVVLLSWLVRM